MNHLESWIERNLSDDLGVAREAFLVAQSASVLVQLDEVLVGRTSDRDGQQNQTGK